MNILVTGGTGLIGKQLCLLLREKGYNIFILSRSNSNTPNTYYWNIEDDYIEPKAIEEADFIIHLAGAGIVDSRWTKSRKKELINSRVKSTKLLYQKTTALNPKLKGFIAASGIGYYGAITSEKIFTENDAVGTDFIAIKFFSNCSTYQLPIIKLLLTYSSITTILAYKVSVIIHSNSRVYFILYTTYNIRKHIVTKIVNLTFIYCKLIWLWYRK